MKGNLEAAAGAPGALDLDQSAPGSNSTTGDLFSQRGDYAVRSERTGDRSSLFREEDDEDVGDAGVTGLVGTLDGACGSRALLRFGTSVIPAVVGAGGIRVDKEEGDGATPAGLLPLRRVLYRADRVSPPVTLLRREAIAPEDGWCDDPGHRDYNRHVTQPFDGRHERLWREDRIYDLLVVLGWNDAPVRSGRGSAIFLHLTSPDERPTEGCIAVAPDALRMMLANGLTAIRVMPGAAP